MFHCRKILRRNLSILTAYIWIRLWRWTESRRRYTSRCIYYLPLSMISTSVAARPRTWTGLTPRGPPRSWWPRCRTRAARARGRGAGRGTTPATSTTQAASTGALAVTSCHLQLLVYDSVSRFQASVSGHLSCICLASVCVALLQVAGTLLTSCLFSALHRRDKYAPAPAPAPALLDLDS